MTPFKVEGDIPSPGRLLLIDEESSGEPIIHNPGDLDLSGATKPVSRPCECNVGARPPVLLESQTLAQGLVGYSQVESTSW